jgi:ABC-type multidrug transport system fused ATPase/permease subunit
MKIVEQSADADSGPRSSVTIDNLFQHPQHRKDWRRLPRLIRQAFSLVRAAAGRTLGEDRQSVPQECEPVGSFQDLLVERVKFTYPMAAKPSLSEVSLHIKAGEIVALVGENGSGKTTLVKILAGLYQPQSGEILLNRMPVGRYDPDAIRSLIAVVFQDFVRYHLTAREDLSIGQWQKVALARAFFRDSPFVVLDEPAGRSISRLIRNSASLRGHSDLHTGKDRDAARVECRTAGPSRPATQRSLDQ